ncbi:Hypothetical protein PHPALM_17112 [Phytophthora palmivora]|uniref:Uncharacterized protein n=1 Tax=Phytophthora palmivora TaxID=4796 RepID=A0A2P4XN24_9STRA|nr:Hypothetical protein PHPALM_17112 [Phytophthora palmivora]
MDFPLCVMDGLREIYNLVDVIHRQRRVNRKTYLRLVEIYVELQMSESLLLNARLQRTDAIGRFTKVVDTFYMYLRKYHDMRWHGRIFKQAAMEEERVKVVDEIDRLLKILNLTSNIAVIKGEAVASTNALKLFSRLKHIHGDIKFTHGHIHAALLADRHQIELTRTKKMPEPEPVVEHKKRASILRTNSSVLMSVEKDDTLPTFEKNSTGEAIQLPETILENVEGGDQSASYDEEEEKAPVTVNAELVQGTPDVMVGATLPMDELKNSGPENVMENSLYEMEEKAPLCFKLELVSIDDEEICSSILETEEIKKDELKLRITDEKFGTNNCKIIKKGTTVDVVEDKNEQTSPLVNTFTGEVEETRDRSQRLQYSTSSTAEDPSVPLLIQLLGSNDATSQQKEEALLRLLRKCINNNNRVQIYKTKGIPVLAHLVRSSDNFFTQLYALHCLSWFTFSYSKMRESEFVELQRCVRHPTHPEILSLLHELQLEDEQVKEVAVLQCSCLATRGDGVVLRQVGVLPPVIELLKTGTSNQKLWAAETLVTLASDDDDNCEAIMDGGAIPPLVTLLRSGTDMQKQEAAFALGNLAANNEVNRVKIAREGAIPPMVEFVKAVTDAQNQWAVYALGFLSVNNEENRVLIAQEGAIPSLVALLRTGTRAQKLWAAYTLGNLAHNDDNRVKITQEGAIASLVNLLRTGTAMVKQRAVFALGNLAGDNDVATDFDEAILPLVDLVRTGSDTQMEDAAYTLGKLASNNNDSRAEIGQRGAIPPLVKLLKIGHDDQKQWAAFALRYLAYNNDVNRVAIVEEGAIPSLLLLMDEGTDEQKEQASHALKHLVAKNDVITHAFIPNRLMVWGDIVDPLVGSASRWHSSHIGVMQTPDRLGDSLVTTLRSSTLKVINDSQIVALWSRKLVKQLVEYEREDRILIRGEC